MLIWKSSNPVPTSPAHQEFIYNGLDACVTLEVLTQIKPQLNEITQKVYDFELSLQGPILEMNLHGIQINKTAKQELYLETLSTHDRVSKNLDLILSEGLGIFNFNPGSPQQKKVLLYETLGLPHVRARTPDGSFKVTTNRKALESLSSYFQATTICEHIICIQELRKKLGFLKTGIDVDGRMRTSFSIAGTDTGRLSSSRSAFYSGTNFQNIDPRLRRMFEADAGYKIGYIDLEQAEARAVGALIWNVFHDGKYLDFCESGDLHTNVAKMTWKNLGWTGDSTHDKLLAKTKFYRDFSYRDASKRVGHASNYFGKPPHISKEVRIPVGLVQEFQRGYFGAFPSISEWHNWVRTQLLKKGFITTFMGRQRWFHGRLWDDTTLRAAIAYEPQSAIADYLNTGLLRVWKSNKVQLLAQIHDAILFQYPEHLENEVIPFVQKTLSIEIPLFHNRSFSIPTEAFVGWNWGYAFNDKKEMVNPDGLVLFSCNDKRSRTKETSLMDRRFRGVY